MRLEVLLFSFLMLILGLYLVIIGWQWLAMKSKAFDIYTLFSLWLTKKFQGEKAMEAYRHRILTTRNFKFYGIYFISGGILQLIMGMMVLFAN